MAAFARKISSEFMLQRVPHKFYDFFILQCKATEILVVGIFYGDMECTHITIGDF